MKSVKIKQGELNAGEAWLALLSMLIVLMEEHNCSKEALKILDNANINYELKEQ